MTLDPQARLIVDTLTAIFPDLGGRVTDAAEARAILARAPQLPVLVDLPSVVDRAIPNAETAPDAPDIPVRIYRPTPDQNTVTPVIIFFHGGGFSIGNIAMYDNLCRDLARSTEATVISVEYRLAPETPYPGGLHDAYAATAWVADHASELCVDPDRLAVAGDSAGGNLAAVVSLMARDRAERGEKGPRIAFQLLIYPSVDFADAIESVTAFPSRAANADGFFLTAQHMRWFDAQYLQGADRRDPHISPLRAADHSGLPPACVITAEHDPLRDEGDAYAAKLAAAGVPVRHLPVEGMFHGFLSMPHPIADRVRAEVFEAVKRALS
ncbi:alpha/beta hydrolase [Catenulispora yoronensis]|uniref:Alpha/beta hydrolase n=1 Tax=Catenulispora yoronensis TaxID=450799 RepID=A0ABP5GM10_9ACTN